MPHKWADWLHYLCRLGCRQRFKAGDKLYTNPQVGILATSPLPSRGSPMLQCGGENQPLPTSGQMGYICHIGCNMNLYMLCYLFFAFHVETL